MRFAACALACLALAGPVEAQTPDTTSTTAGDPWTWRGAAPTPEVTLTLFPVGTDTVGGRRRARYKALALGLEPRDRVTAWAFPLGASRGVCLQSGFAVDSTGRVVCEPGSRAPEDTCALCTLPLDQIVLAATGYAPGEPYRIGVLSRSGGKRAYAEAFPVPIEAASDSLRLHLEMVTPDGLEYAVIGEGFRPGSKIGITTRSADRSGSQKMIVPASGAFRLEVLPQVAGEPTGFASVTVQSADRRLTLDWPWGRGAFKNR